MHEHAAIENVVAAILKDPKLSGVSCVREVRLKIGAMEFHSEAAFRQGFEVASKGTPLEGARLTLDILWPMVECPACGHQAVCREGEIDPHEKLPFRECPKCRELAPIRGGRGIESIELSVEDEKG